MARKLSMVFVALITALVLVGFVQVSLASAATKDSPYNVPVSGRAATHFVPYTSDEQKGHTDFVVNDGSYNVPVSSRGPINVPLLTRDEEHTAAYGGMTNETSRGFVPDASFNRPISHR